MSKPRQDDIILLSQKREKS